MPVSYGLPHHPDFNGITQEGVGLYQVTQQDGLRHSSAAVFLAPVRRRPNLTVFTHTLTERVLFDCERAVGVQVRQRGGVRRWIEDGEVILSGGGVNSPQLLLLSGIGPADHLRALGIRVVRDLPAVGENLQDHLDICTLTACTLPVTYDKVSVLRTGVQFWLTRQGVGTTNAAEGGGFMRLRHAADARCDLQLPPGTCRMGRDETSVVDPHRCACAASTVCAWSMPPSCPKSPAATPMRQH